MNSHQRKVLRDHAAKHGHLVSQWDRKDLSWYARNKISPSGKYIVTSQKVKP